MWLDYETPTRRDSDAFMQPRRSMGAALAILSTVGVILLMVWLAWPRFGRVPGEAQRKAVMADIENLRQALDAFRRDTGRYPSTEEGLRALTEEPAARLPGWRGPYWKFRTNDPWGNPYRYSQPGRQGKPFDLSCCGPDGAPGGGDDISVNDR
jgi:general secretion pathway protein G